jgi:hypothetical protein
MEPVGVYVGSAAYRADPMFDIVAGGHGKDASAVAAIVPAAAPPVCHAEYVPAKGISDAPNA